MEKIKVLIYDCGKGPEIREIELLEGDRIIVDGEVKGYSPFKISERLLNEVQETEYVQKCSFVKEPTFGIFIDSDGRLKGLPANRIFRYRGEYHKIAGRLVIMPIQFNRDAEDFIIRYDETLEPYIITVYKDFIEQNSGDGTDSEHYLSQEDSDAVYKDIQVTQLDMVKLLTHTFDSL